MKEMRYTHHEVILEPLTLADALPFYNLYAHPQLLAGFDESPFLPQETPEEFTMRIMGLCERIYTIRLKDDASVIVGDCALHHREKEKNAIEIGGSLLPDYWGMGIMRSAFQVLMDIAKQELDVKTILARTATNNQKAIRLAEKMGFETVETKDGGVVLRMEIG